VAGRRGIHRGFPPLHLGSRTLSFDEPVIMGVVNVTPDSFSPGHSTETERSIAHGVALWRAGAVILDVGGEATNPWAKPVAADEECARVLPVILGLAAATDAILSIDTTKAAVAERAVAAGATLINDVSGGRFDVDMIAAAAALARSHQAAYVASHLRGSSIAEVFAAESHAQEPTAPGLTWEAVVAELAEQVAALPAVVRERSLVDPGLGFGKGAGSLNLELLGRGQALVEATGRPVLMGPSRKRFLQRLLAPGPGLDARSERRDDLIEALDAATVGACLAAVRGGAQVLRVHNVALLRPALAVYIKQ
jgi:dihydropteroate synthase